MLKTRSSYILQWLGLSIGLSILAVTIYVTIQNRTHKQSDKAIPLIDIMGKVHVKYQSKPTVLHVSSAKAVWDYYEKTGFTMKNLQAGRVDVPRIYLANIISTWADNESVSFKKDLFFRTMLPLILRVNEINANDRERVLILKDQSLAGQIMSINDVEWLRQLAKSYRIPRRSKSKTHDDIFFNKLLERVDEIPISMALGQAAYESAYATSRFAMEGNSLFGQWRWGSGLTPREQRGQLGDYRIADYKTPLDSTFAFAKNLNSNNAYEKFRILRAQLRAENKPLSGVYLAQGLDRYSERGVKYIQTLQQIIVHNQLDKLDTVTLGSGKPVTLVPTWPED
jgi:Bax protein